MIKRRGGSQIGNLTSNYKSLESKGQMRSNWNMLYTIEKIFSKAIRYFLRILEIDFIWKRYERPKLLQDNKNPSFRTPKKKWHLNVVPAKRDRVYYREGNGASSQRLWAVWSLCLKLSLLSLSHHFHSTYTNCPLFLVV
jgi:hypothetical protein